MYGLIIGEVWFLEDKDEEALCLSIMMPFVWPIFIQLQVSSALPFICTEPLPLFHHSFLMNLYNTLLH